MYKPYCIYSFLITEFSTGTRFEFVRTSQREREVLFCDSGGSRRAIGTGSKEKDKWKKKNNIRRMIFFFKKFVSRFFYETKGKCQGGNWGQRYR